MPFHYGYWDTGAIGNTDGDHHRAANELTITSWDPVSKQPIFKVAAVRVRKLARAAGTVSPAPTVGGSAPRRPCDPGHRGWLGSRGDLRRRAE